MVFTRKTNRCGGIRKAHAMKKPSAPCILYTHPFELAVGAILLISGLRALYDQSALPASIDYLPVVFGVVYRVLLAFSGALIIAGLLIKANGIGPALEQMGLWIAGTVFGVYGVAAVWLGVGPAATIFAATLFCIAAACGFRARSITKQHRAIGYVIREAKRRGEPHE